MGVGGGGGADDDDHICTNVPPVSGVAKVSYPFFSVDSAQAAWGMTGKL